MTMIYTDKGIEAYRLLALKGRMQLEMKGLRFKINTFPAVKREFGLKGNHEKVYAAYCDILRERGLIE